MARLLLPLLSVSICLVACSPTAAPVGAAPAQAVTMPTASAPVVASAQTGSSASTAVIDFRRNVIADAVQVAPEEQKSLVSLIFDGKAQQDASITTRINGSFTASGVTQEAVIAVPEGASSINPFPEPATLAILQDGKVVAKHTFSKESAAWQWPVKAVDLNADGVDELLLTASYMQMGESGTSLLVASMQDGNFAQKQVIENVQTDDCAAQANRGTLNNGRSEAVVLTSDGKGGLTQQRYAAPCGPLDTDGNPATPKPDDYKPLTDSFGRVS